MPRDTAVELWTLYAFGVLVTTLRTYARLSAVGYRELRADDYLIWFAMVTIPIQVVNPTQLTDNRQSYSTRRKPLSDTTWELPLTVSRIME